MRNNRLFAVLRTLDKKEFLEFSRYVTNGILKKGPKAVLLLKHIKKFHPEFDDDQLHRAVIYRKLFKQRMFLDEAKDPKRYTQDTKRVLDIVGDLTNLAEEYIIILRMRKKEVDYQMLRMNALQDKGLDEMHQKVAITS